MNSILLPGRLRTLTPVAVATLVVLLATGIATYVAFSEGARAKDQFEANVTSAQEAISDRLTAALSPLRASAGFLTTNPYTTREELANFIARLELPKHYAGVQGIAFAKRVNADEKVWFLSAMHRKTPDFRIWPEGRHPVYFPIVCLEPSDVHNSKAIGYDLYTEPVRSEAMRLAADEASPHMSGKVSLVQDLDDPKQAATLLFMPVYRQWPAPKTLERRRSTLAGFIAAPIRFDDFLSALFSARANRPLDIEIFDGPTADPATLMNYSSALRPDAHEYHRFTTLRSLPVAGRTWTIRYASHASSTPRRVGDLPATIFFGGLLISILVYEFAAAQAAARLHLEKTNAEIEISEKRFRALVDQSLLSIQILSPQGVILRVNKAWEAMWGLKLEAIAPYSILEDKGLAKTGMQEYIRRAFAGEAVVIPASLYVPPMGERQGQEMWIRGIIYPVKDDDGALKEVVLIQEDITDLKKAGDEVRRSRDELEKRVEERTLELRRANAALLKEMEERARTEADLQQSRKIEAIGRLAGGVAHDFNNLITGILGMSQDVQATFSLNDPRREELDEIIRASGRASVLTKQLLAFGRRQVTMPKIIDLNAAVRDIEKMLERLIGEDVVLKTDLVEGGKRIKVDPGQLEQVILNLVLNARDAMPDGGTLTISTGEVLLGEDYVKQHLDVRPGPYATLAVTDTGSGMDAETQRRIFDPYFTTKKGGTGLGLSTVYGIVKQHDGDIGVSSQVGRGTTFTIYLPKNSEPPAIESSLAEKVHNSEGTETILVVEDESIVRHVAVKTLRRKGYQVLEACDGLEALRMATDYRDRIHLVLTDVIMPNMNGRQLADQLSALRPEIRILFMSGYAEDVIVNKGILTPGIAFIEKSFTPDSLARKVRVTLDAG